MITINLTEQQYDNLLRLLGRLSFFEVAPLIREIERQRGSVGAIIQMRAVPAVAPEDYGPIEPAA